MPVFWNREMISSRLAPSNTAVKVIIPITRAVWLDMSLTKDWALFRIDF
jgi:hypothetical protein